jgi:hypothetical protein
MRIRSRRYICEPGLRWILNYRMTAKTIENALVGDKQRAMKRLINRDAHSEKSLEWTIKQSIYIDKHGWDKWFRVTRGPSGFQ